MRRAEKVLRCDRLLVAGLLGVGLVLSSGRAAAVSYEGSLWELAISGSEPQRMLRLLDELHRAQVRPPEWSPEFRVDHLPDTATAAKRFVPWLQKLLADPRKTEFACMELALLQREAEPALPALLKVVNDQNRPDRDAALFPIAAMREKAASATGAVFAMYKSATNREERIAAIRTLGILQAKEPEVVAELASALRGAHDYQISATASGALWNLGPSAAAAVPSLIEIFPLADDRTVCRPDQASDTLRRIGEAAVPALITALGDPRSPVRFWAGSTLMKMAHVPPEAVTAALDAWEHGDIDGIEFTTLQGLVGRAAAEAVAPLIVAYDADDTAHRHHIVRIACFRDAEKRALRGLLEHAKADPDAAACLHSVSPGP